MGQSIEQIIRRACRQPRPEPRPGRSLEEVAEEFLQELGRIIDAYGESEADEVFRRLMPNFDYTTVNDMRARLVPETTPQAIKENFILAEKKGGALEKLYTLIAGFTGAGASKVIDQDVDVAEISTDDKLGITLSYGDAPALEKLIGQTNELIKQMVALLSQTQPALQQAVIGVDASVDDLVSAQTGETPHHVGARQAMRVGASSSGPRPTRNRAKR